MKKLLSLFFIFIAFTASAQKVWNLSQCMDYAVKMSYNSQRAERNVQTARQNYTAAIGNHLPSLGASIGAGSNFGRGIDPATNTYISTTTFSNSYGVNVSIPIFNAFELLNNTLKAKLSVARAQSELQKAEDDIALQVMSLYIDVLYTQGLVELTEKRVQTFSTDLLRSERMSELGTNSAADVAQFAASLASEEVALINRTNDYQTSLLKLKDAMNFPVIDTLLIDANITKSEREFESAAEIFDAADQYLPQVDILRKTLREQKYQLAIAKSSYYPSISLSGGVSTNYYTMLSGTDNKTPNFGNQFKDNIGESVSVGMSIPIFRGLSVRTSVQRAKINYSQAQSDHDEKMRALRIEIEQAVMDLRSTQAGVKGADKAVQSTLLAYRAMQRKYDQGMVSVIDLQTSYNSLLMAQVELLSAQLRYEIKSRQVAYFSGEPLIKED